MPSLQNMADCALQCQWMNGITVNYEPVERPRFALVAVAPVWMQVDRQGLSCSSQCVWWRVTSQVVPWLIDWHNSGARFSKNRKIVITELRRIYDRKFVVTELWWFYDFSKIGPLNLTQSSIVIEANTGNLANVSLHGHLAERQDLVQHQCTE